MADCAVEVLDLVVRYGEVTAIDRVSFAVDAGTVSAVLGPNGAGKTSTIETCEGYRRPSAGRVRVLGYDPITERAKLRDQVGVMLQNGGVYTSVSPVEAVRHAAAFYAHPLDVDSLLDRVSLSAISRTPYRRLSGGEKQQVGLALALVGRPRLVFLDEPTAGLDPQARHATWELVRELRAAGVTIVITTHFMDEAELLADQVVIIDRGQVVATGSPDELTGHGPPMSLRFRAPSGLDLTVLARDLPADCTVVETPPGSYRVDGSIGPDALATVTGWCAAVGVMPEGLSIERRTLEEVFLELTGRSR
jgi:ABC-2 type transport system ATP-binding protein